MPENPFVYEQAHLIPTELIAQYYIDDYNHSRLICSRRNIFLVGERGCGKTMALLYNALPVQLLIANDENEPVDTTHVGVLVPANTPLTHRREYKLVDDFQASIASEHFLALSIAFHLADTLRTLGDFMSEEEGDALRAEMELYFDFRLPETSDVLDAICQAAQRESIAAQKVLNRAKSDEIYDKSLAFSSFVIPFMRALKKIAALRNSHFMVMVDDAHNLNEFQVKALNSWIAYRDRSLFSFKVATASVGRPARTTRTGGAILEGHDYLTIDMEHPFHSQTAEFGKFANKVVARRLERVGVTKTPDEFFPIHPRLSEELAVAEEAAREEALKRFPSGSNKQIADFVYKHKWAEFARHRNPKANRPLYSGFATMVFLSTGVIRNLLEPCWWMWDAALSEQREGKRGMAAVEVISGAIQARKIMERSEVAWTRLKALAVTIDGCSYEDGEKVRKLFEGITAHFQRRLREHRSEPGGTSFSISARDATVMEELDALLEIARKAQLLYARTGSGKLRGERQEYYVPNRMLWPSRGLNPHGQHAIVHVKAGDLLGAAYGTAIPWRAVDDAQHGLFMEDQAREED